MTKDSPPSSAGRYYDDLEIGAIYRSHLGRTITDADNIWFTNLTLNTNQIHFNSVFAKETRFGQLLVNSTLTLALVTGLSVVDLSQNAICNLGWTDVRLPHPVFVGDTLWAESEVLEKRESRSQPGIGIVTVRSRGLNQHGNVVIEFRRTFMIPKADAAPAQALFPETDEAWRI
jgi:itaconyl-CoA hydratase